MRRILIYGGLGLLVLLSGILLWANLPGEQQVSESEPPLPEGVSSATQSRYDEVEIRDYQGQRLDPSTGPRDNSILGIQEVDLETYRLEVTGLVERPLTLTYDQVLEEEHIQRLVRLICVEGWTANILWEGVRLTELLDQAGPSEEALIAIFHCADGYTTSLPLDTIRERDLLLAFSSNGIDLPSALGAPLILVAEDKLGYKWARWIEIIELSDDAEYRGYWESRGFPNDADIRK